MKLYRLILLISMLAFLMGVFAENYSDSQLTTLNESPKLDNKSKSEPEPVNQNDEFEEDENPILIWAIIINILALVYYVYRYFIKE